MTEADTDEKEEAKLRHFGLRITDDTADGVRQVLREQIALESRAQGNGNTLLMRLCCVQLFGLAQTEDILLIWQAKQSSFDASCSVDVQLLCGVGQEETVQFLKASPLPIAKDALEYVIDCQETGDFDSFSPDAWYQAEEQYYSGTG